MAPVPIERLRGLPSFAEPSYLPAGYVLRRADAVLGAEDVKSYELHYGSSPLGWSLIVARIVGYTLPYDVQRPLLPPQGYTQLSFGSVDGTPAAFTSLRDDPSVVGGTGTIVVAAGGTATHATVTIIVGSIARDPQGPGTMTFDDLLKVAQSTR